MTQEHAKQELQVIYRMMYVTARLFIVDPFANHSTGL